VSLIVDRTKNRNEIIDKPAGFARGESLTPACSQENPPLHVLFAVMYVVSSTMLRRLLQHVFST
jgi:hypothetical protein